MEAGLSQRPAPAQLLRLLPNDLLFTRRHFTGNRPPRAFKQIGRAPGANPGVTGLHDCRLLSDFESENAFTLVEAWSFQADLDRHLVSKAFRILVTFIEMSMRPPLIRLDTVERSAGSEVMEQARHALGLL